jgi:hypothetical protein
MVVERPPMSEEELTRQNAAAVERGRHDERTQPRARTARYNRDSGRIELELRNGCLFAVPAELVEGLAAASPSQLAAIRMTGNGHSLRWEELDVDISVPALLDGRFGTAKWMAQWGGSGWNAPAASAARADVEPEPVRRRKAS